MAIINAKLLKKRSEHHDGLLIDLEELSLHQQGIEKIEYIGSVCTRLRILLLQNNLISRIENINKLKDLEYLNLAINNITRIEGLSSCESLKKLDLTVNYINFAAFKESVANLQSNFNLEDLYLAGNPVAVNWDRRKYRLFVIGSLPQLKQLDGELVTISERIEAKASLDALSEELEHLAVSPETPFSFGPDSRKETYFDVNPCCKEDVDPTLPPLPQPSPVFNTRGEVRQCNEGGYKYTISETFDEAGTALLCIELALPKFMETSLIDVDLNPTYVRCIVKNRVTQIKFDDEVEISTGKVVRSKTTGWLKITAPIIGRRSCRRVQSTDCTTESFELYSIPPALEPLV